ncbi:MAG: right-handed parallel beta-helix repeat-containing protein [Verrucomicrobiae bacterium]|nr:right-handed parallel beta-helix repeat-containing protein [Verrucomicrobiae bacterium]
MFRSIFLPCFAVVFPASAADIILSPSGPISTPLAARDAARAAAKPVRIVVEAGTYPLTEALALEAKDSEVTWESAPNAKPVFTGGRSITGWTKAEGGLWKAPLRDPQWQFDQLWIDGRRATQARTPNRGFFHLADRVSADGTPTDTHRVFQVHQPEFDLLDSIPEAERAGVLLTVTHSWSVGQCRIEQLDRAARSVTIKGHSRYPFGEREPDQRFWMENFRSALDAPGEWFHDRTKGELLYHPLPDEDLTKAEVVAPVSEKFLVIQGARDITFRGLSFQHEQYRYPEDGLHDGQAATIVDGAIDVSESRGIRFDRCEIAHVGRYAVYFRNGCSDASLTHCHLHDLGAGGVRIGETNRPEEERICRDITVDDCIIQHGGRLHPSACGIVMTHAQRCSAVHCDIGDFFYTGVSIGWNWGYGESVGRDNRVENCHIHHLGWAYLSDMGGFYGLGNAPGTTIRGNHIHHIASHRYGGWGLYTDEGSGDVLMENNLVHDTSDAGFHQHYGYANRVRNNIFAFGGKAQIQRSRNEPRLTFVFERNLVVWDPALPLLDGAETNWKLNDRPDSGSPRDTVIFRRNLYWPTDGKIPTLLTKTHFSWEEWRKMGRDAGSLFADPKFVNLAERDFRLQPDNPAAKIGFQAWDLSLAGVRAEDPAWRGLAAEGHVYPNWEIDAKPWPAPEFRLDLETFESIAPGQLGLPRASYDRENKGESIGVTEEAASPLPITGGTPSKRSLKVQDAPRLAHSYDPVLDFLPRWAGGTFEVSFDIMAHEKADWFFEMRVNGGEFAAGPYVRWQNGKLVATNAGSVKLADLPPGEWCRIAIRATTGAGHYGVTLTRADGTVTEFKEIPCKPEWNEASYLLFSAVGTSEAAFFIDNLRLTPMLAP